MAYTSTLLASLIAVQYEKPLNTFKVFFIKKTDKNMWEICESDLK